MMGETNNILFWGIKLSYALLKESHLFFLFGVMQYLNGCNDLLFLNFIHISYGFDNFCQLFL